MECLLEQGVDAIFGYPGGQVLPIYDALYTYGDRIKHYLTSHEQGAAHAADGYARSTGRVGVCLATSGPGATNLVTGIATAYMDSSPIVAITGNVPVPLLGKDSFQEVDITGITMPITKHNYIVKDIRELADTVRKAFYIARHGRPGPVLIDIPKDVTTQTCAYERQPPLPVDRITKFLSASDLQSAADLIAASEKPLVYSGGGVIAADASTELVEFIERADAPICVSAMGLGGVPASNARFTGMIGMHGTGASNTLATECDLLIAVGARFSDRVISNVKRFAPNAKIIHIDVDPAEINKNVATVQAVVGDVKLALAQLNALLSSQQHDAWMARVNALKAAYPLTYKANGYALQPQYVIERIAALAGDDAIIVTEVGQHQMWACQHVPVEKPRSFITSGGLGTMGFGLGAAIGAAVANPGKTIVNIAGDGCFRMNCIEIATAVEYDLPVIIVVINNHALGMVRQWQTLFFDKRYSHTSLHGKSTDFVKLAEAFGAAAWNATTPDEVDTALRAALKLGKPAVINCEIHEDEKVFPMVAPGAGIDQFVTREIE